MTKGECIQSINKVCRDLMLSEPFYGLFLSTLNKEIDNSIETAGVSKRGINAQLSVNSEFWESLTPNIRIGVAKHELLHLAFFHLTLRDKYQDKLLFNIAADICINYLIDPKYKSPEFLHYKSFGDLGLENGKDTDYYYKALYKEKEEHPEGQLAQNLEQWDPQVGYDPGKAHQFWKEFEQLSESDKKLVQKQIEYQLKEVGEQLKSRGYIPAEMKGLIDSLLNPKPPALNWKSYLRRFAGGSNKVYTKKIRRKSSRRFEDNPGLKVKQKKHILVFNDSSGSVSDKDYSEFINEIYHIHKTGTEVTIGDFDADVKNIRKFTKAKDITREGYGGTDFNPPVSYYNKHKSKYCSCIIFTDGYCSAPSVKPLGKILWVICTNGVKIELPGQVIQIPKNE